MSKRVKPLSIEEQKALRNKAKLELLRLDALLNDEENIERISRFKEKFSICEIVYKVVLSEHQLKKNGKRPERMRVDMNQAPYALSFAGYDFDRGLLSKLFGGEERVGKRSVKKLRDALTHSLKPSAIEELNNREKELYGYMDTFLEKIKTFDETIS